MSLSLLKAFLLALQVTDKLVPWLRERQLISAGRHNSSPRTWSDRMPASAKPWKHAGIWVPMILALMIPTGATDAAERQICLLDFQVLDTGAGVFCDEPADVVDTSCQAFGPIHFSRSDTDQTRQQIRVHNAAWDVLRLHPLAHQFWPERLDWLSVQDDLPKFGSNVLSHPGKRRLR